MLTRVVSLTYFAFFEPMAPFWFFLGEGGETKGLLQPLEIFDT
jgi:hypothetical protein